MAFKKGDSVIIIEDQFEYKTGDIVVLGNKDDGSGTFDWRAVKHNGREHGGYVNESWIKPLAVETPKKISIGCINPPDNVNHPPHYTNGGIETLDFIKAKLTREQYEGYLRGNIIKYIARYDNKGGTEDIKKAEFYQKKLLELKEPINPVLRIAPTLTKEQELRREL